MLISREEVLKYTSDWLDRLHQFGFSYRTDIVHAIHNHNDNLKSTSEIEICRKFVEKIKEYRYDVDIDVKPGYESFVSVDDINKVLEEMESEYERNHANAKRHNS